MIGVGVACTGDTPSIALGAIENVVNNETERETIVTNGLINLGIPDGATTIHGTAFVTAAMKLRKV